MSWLNFIITVILFSTVYTRQISLIANHIVIYQPSTDSSSIKTITFESTSSCSACLCAAFMANIDYVAINCYKYNNTCSLFTSSVNFTGVVPIDNGFLYLLPYIPKPPTPEDDSMSSSSVTTTTLTSTASFTITTTNSMTAVSTSIAMMTGMSTASKASVGYLTVTTKTIARTTMDTVPTTASRSTTTTSRSTTTTSRTTTTTSRITTTTTTRAGGSCTFFIFFCS